MQLFVPIGIEKHNPRDVIREDLTKQITIERGDVRFGVDANPILKMVESILTVLHNLSVEGSIQFDGGVGRVQDFTGIVVYVFII